MIPEFSGIERRLDELNKRLARLEPFREKQRSDFDEDAYLRDIVERNLEIAAQRCIDINTPKFRILRTRATSLRAGVL